MDQQIKQIVPDVVSVYTWDQAVNPGQITQVAQGDIANMPNNNLASLNGQSSPPPGQALRSSNFVTGVSGWQLDTNGNFEANTGKFRGQLIAGSIDIPNTTSANSFHVDSTGNAWWGATTLGSAIAYVKKDGSALFTVGTIGGWTLTSTQIKSSGSEIVLDSSAKSISVGTGSSTITVDGTTGTIHSNNATWNLKGDSTINLRFGGTGADGALAISSGTTTINLGNASVVVKNYTSISITGTGVLAFSNPYSGGTSLIIKCQTNATLTSTTVPFIDMRGCGGSGGTGGDGKNAAGSDTGNSGTDGGDPFDWGVAIAQSRNGRGAGNTNAGSYGGNGGGGGAAISSGGSGGTGNTNVGTASGGTAWTTQQQIFIQSPQFAGFVYLIPGAGGGGGSGSRTGGTIDNHGTGGAGGSASSPNGTSSGAKTGGANTGSPTGGGGGGAGAGALYMEIAGTLTFTIVNGIDLSGGNGGNSGNSVESGVNSSSASGGAGGGGSGGTGILFYNAINNLYPPTSLPSALQAKIISYWRMEGNSNDSVSTNNGTDTNMSYSTSDGSILQGAHFSGTGYITVGDIAALRFTMATPFTLYGRIKTTSGTLGRISGKVDSDHNGEGYSMVMTAAGKIRFDMTNTAGAGASVTGAVTVNDGVYHRIVCSYDGSGNSTGMKIYVDDVLDTAGIGVGDLTGTLDGGDPFIIGAREAGNQPWTGSGDEFSVFNQALTTTEISQLGSVGIGSIKISGGLAGTAGTATGGTNNFAGANGGAGRAGLSVIAQNILVA